MPRKATNRLLTVVRVYGRRAGRADLVVGEPPRSVFQVVHARRVGSLAIVVRASARAGSSKALSPKTTSILRSCRLTADEF
jgi:hypothetical protein